MTTMTKNSDAEIEDPPMYCGLAEGRPFNAVDAELVSSGFTRGRPVKNRKTGCSTVIYSRHGESMGWVVEVTHEWNVEPCGIGRPGKVVSAKAARSYALLGGVL